MGVGNRRTTDLPQVLAACGFDQPVDSVISIVDAGLNALIFEENGLLGVVTNMSDVACWIVGVMEVLQNAFVR